MTVLRRSIALTVNGQVHTLEVETRRTLAEVVREELGLTGTHLGCEHGVCGACTVIVDGAIARSCLMLAVQADGATIETVESLATDGVFHPIQQAMWEQHGFQCAFCAAGFLMTAKALLDVNPHPTREQIREELSGNLCRCTGYASIIAGVEAAILPLAQRSATAPSSAEVGHA
jgi:aerobic-type carbon monoxide dehydrogenase small subunit (CoxS/CutS family)